MVGISEDFFITRGNHEAEDINRVYGFKNEVLKKYDTDIFKQFQRVFEWLPLAHCVNQTVLIMHGGVPCGPSPSYSGPIKSDPDNGTHEKDGADVSLDVVLDNTVTLDDIRALRRGCQVPKKGLMCDLLWADPQVSCRTGHVTSVVSEI